MPDTGIAEAMGMLGAVLGEVQTLAGNLSSIVEQTIGDTSFISLFKTIIARLDTVTLAVQGLIKDNRVAIDRSIGNLQTLTDEAKQLLERNAPGIDSIVAHGETLSQRAVVIAESVDTITQSVHAILEQLDNEKSSVGKLIRDKELYHDMKKTIADLDTLVKNVREDALKLRIKFGFGKKRK